MHHHVRMQTTKTATDTETAWDGMGWEEAGKKKKNIRVSVLAKGSGKVACAG